MPSHYKLPFLRGKIYYITLFEHELQTAPDLIPERKEATESSTKNAPAFYLETRMYESRSLEKLGQLTFARHSAGEERVTQRKSSRNLHRWPFESLAEYLALHMWLDTTKPGKE